MRRAGFLLAGIMVFAAPVAAGATGAPYIALLAFAGLFFLWSVLTRSPESGPLAPGTRAMFPVTIAIHLALASLLLGTGHMLRALAGIDAEVPLTAWLLVGLAGALLGRMAWPRGVSDGAADLAEAALKRLDETARQAAADRAAQGRVPPPDGGVALTQTDALEALPAGGNVTEAEIAAALARLEDTVTDIRLGPALLVRAETTGTPRDRLAAVWHVTDPGAARDATAQEVFDLVVATADVVALRLFASRAAALLTHDPAARQALPDPARLTTIATEIEALHPGEADLLTDLAGRIEDLRAEEEDA